MPQTIVTITDGYSTQPGTTILAAQEVRKRLIDSVVVAIGTNVNDEEIETIATDSDSIYRYDFTREIDHLEISDRVCPGIKQFVLTHCLLVSSAYNLCKQF